MSFTPLQQLLAVLVVPPPRPEAQLLHRIVQQWPELVGGNLAAHTRPIALHRHVLQIATSNAGWTQTLMFERLRILQQLNDRYSSDLSDLRFSTAQWHQYQTHVAMEAAAGFARGNGHPSSVHPAVAKTLTPRECADPPKQAQVAFQQWTKRVHDRARNWPLCPQCHTPTPAGELERWGTCSLCSSSLYP